MDTDLWEKLKDESATDDEIANAAVSCVIAAAMEHVEHKDKTAKDRGTDNYRKSALALVFYSLFVYVFMFQCSVFSRFSESCKPECTSEALELRCLFSFAVCLSFGQLVHQLNSFSAVYVIEGEPGLVAVE